MVSMSPGESGGGAAFGATDGPPSIGLGDIGDAPSASQSGQAPPGDAGIGNPFAPPPTSETAFGVPPPPSGPGAFSPPPPAAPPAAPPPPSLQPEPSDSMPGIAEFNLSGLDAPSLSPDVGVPGEIDLPQPVDRPDLPAPVQRRSPGAPPAPAGAGQPSNLPAPVELNLPAPVELNLPAPVELNLPAPAGSPGASTSNVDLPVPVDLDLPVPVDLDLPMPAGQGLAPAGQGLTPAGQGLTPAGQGLTPAGQDLEPAGQGLTPAGQELEPAGQGLTPANLGLAPAEQGLAPVPGAPGVAPMGPGGALPPGVAGSPAAAAAGVPGVAGALPPPLRGASPANKINPSRAPSRGLMIGLGGLVVVALAGVGIMSSGLLDGPEDPQPGTRGAGGSKPAPTPGAEGVAVDRTPEVVAKLAADTPAGYAEAITLAEAGGDVVGAAEAAYALHFRFGPDPERVTKAAGQLATYQTQKDPFVQRVVGLAALSAGKLDQAEPALVGEDARTRMYRGWLRLAQGRPADALTEAQAALVAMPDDLGALCLKLVAQTKTNPELALAEAATAAKAHPGHLGVLQAQVGIALELGHLRVATTALTTAALPEGASAATKAHLLQLRGDVAAGAGLYAQAATHYKEAQALIPSNTVAGRKRARVLVKANSFAEAEAVTGAILKQTPNEPEAHLLDAEVLIAGGSADRATETLEKVGKALSTDPRVPYLTGQVFAMRLQVEEAQAQFAAARERDATFYKASVDEALLLAKLKKADAAEKLLADARAAAKEGGRNSDLAELHIASAQLLKQQNKPAEAIAALTQALGIAPAHNAAQLQRGVLRIANGAGAEGEADLVAVFDRTGGFPGLASPLGLIYLRDNRVDDLEALVGGQLNGDATPRDLVLIGARLRLLQGKVAEAKALIQVGIANDPSGWEPQMLLSEALIQENDIAGALTAIEKSVPKEPKAEHWLQKGRVYEFNGRHDDARPLYFKATRLDPELHEARFLYGRALETSGEYTGAVRELSTVIAAEGAKTAAWYPEAWMHLGIAQSATGKSAEGIASLEQATKLNNKLGKAWAKLGEQHARNAKHGAAIAALTTATKLGTSADTDWYPDALMNLGRAQQKTGKATQAKATFKKFLDVAAANHSGRAEARRVLGI